MEFRKKREIQKNKKKKHTYFQIKGEIYNVLEGKEKYHK